MSHTHVYVIHDSNIRLHTSTYVCHMTVVSISEVHTMSHSSSCICQYIRCHTHWCQSACDVLTLDVHTTVVNTSDVLTLDVHTTVVSACHVLTLDVHTTVVSTFHVDSEYTHDWRMSDVSRRMTHDSWVHAM